MPPKAKPLTPKQKRFVREYAIHGNGTEAARKAGYRNGKALPVTASRMIRRANVAQAIDGELAQIAVTINPERVRRRLDQISHKAEADGQYGPAVRAEELLGKSIGMWIDQSLQLTGVLNDSHVAALLDYAKRRTIEPVDNRDDDDD